MTRSAPPRDSTLRSRSPGKMGVAILCLLLAGPAAGAVEVSVEPDRIEPVSLGGEPVWNGYVAVTVLRDGRAAAGVPVELRGPSGAVAQGDTNGEGVAVLPVVSREPGRLDLFVEGGATGRGVELAGPPGPAPPPSPPSPAASPAGDALALAGALAAGIATGGIAVALSRRRRKKNEQPHSPLRRN